MQWGASSKQAKILVEATILAVLICCYFARYYITNLFECLGGLLSNGVDLFLRERVLESTPTPLF